MAPVASPVGETLSDAARHAIETYGRETPEDELAMVLFEAWCLADPSSGPANHHASYMATFADMAHAALSRRSLDEADGGVDAETRAFIDAVQLVEDAGFVVLRPEKVASPARSAEVVADHDSLRILEDFAQQYRSGDQGAEMDRGAAQAVALSIDDVLHCLSIANTAGEGVGLDEDAVGLVAHRIADAVQGNPSVEIMSEEERDQLASDIQIEAARCIRSALTARKAGDPSRPTTPSKPEGEASPAPQGGVRVAAEGLLAHWDRHDGPEKRGEYAGVEYWSPAGRTVDTEFIAALRSALEASPAAVSEEMVKRAARAMFEEGGVVSWDVAAELANTDPVYGSVLGSFRRASRLALTAALAAKGGQ